MSDSRRVAILLLAMMTLAACSQKEPAETAIDAAETALAAVHEQAQQYIPKEYAEAKARLDEGRKAFGEERYAEAVEIVKDLPARARQLGEEAAAAREQLAAQIAADWQHLTESMPGLLAGLESRLAELGKLRRLPEGVGKEAVERAGSGLELVKGTWDRAGQAFESGNLEGAVARGLEADRLIRELMELVGVQPAPDAPPAS